MSMTEAVSESRRRVDDAVAAAPTKVAAARAALSDMGGRARDLVVGVQSRARDQIDRRRSVTADRLASLAEALRPEGGAARARRKALFVAGGSGLALVAVLGAGVALGLVLSRQMKKRADLRAAEARTLIKETPPRPQAIEQDPVAAGLNL